MAQKGGGGGPDPLDTPPPPWIRYCITITCAYNVAVCFEPRRMLNVGHGGVKYIVDVCNMDQVSACKMDRSSILHNVFLKYYKF